MATTLGLKCKLYRGPAGSQANIEMKNVSNVTLNLEKGEADITTRKANGWRMSAATLKEASIEFEMLYDPDDADFAAVFNAFLNDTPLAIFVTDGAGSGLDCDCVVMNVSQDQSLEEAVKANVTLKPTDIGGDGSRAPQWVDASSPESGSGSGSGAA